MEVFCPYPCSYKTGAGYCGRTSGYLLCQYQAVHGNTAVGFVPPVPKTRADRIRQMTDEELADFIANISYPECPVCPAYQGDLCEGWSDDCREKMCRWLREEATP